MRRSWVSRSSWEERWEGEEACDTGVFGAKEVVFTGGETLVLPVINEPLEVQRGEVPVMDWTIVSFPWEMGVFGDKEDQEENKFQETILSFEEDQEATHIQLFKRAPVWVNPEENEEDPDKEGAFHDQKKDWGSVLISESKRSAHLGLSPR